MSGVAFNVEIDSADAVAGLRAALKRFASSGDLMEQVAGIVESGARARIEDDKAGPDGRRWKPWSPRYAAQQGGRGSLLRQRSRLLDSITSVADRDSAEVGTNLVYARIHQLGGNAGRGGAAKIPARPYLGVSDDGQAEIREAASDWLQTAIGAGR